MMKMIKKLRLVLGAMLLAGVLYALVTVPGLASDLASTVPERPTLEAFR